MRLLLLFSLAATLAAGDSVVRSDGKPLTGKVVSLTLTMPDGEVRILQREDLEAVRLQGDREYLDIIWLNRTLRFALDRGRGEGRVGRPPPLQGSPPPGAPEVDLTQRRKG